MGEGSRLTGVFFEPMKTFQDIARRPTFVVPMILALVAAIGFVTALSKRVGWGPLVRQQVEANRQFQQLPADQREQAIDRQVRFMPVIMYASVIIGVPLNSLMIAGVLLGLAAMMGAGLRFPQVFCGVAWAGLPRVLSALLTIVVVFLKNPEDFNLRNPTAFNLGAFLDPNTASKFTYALATSLDLFTIWNILLLAVMLKATAGKKLTFTGALVAVAVPWAILVLGGAALASAFM
jgi:hypothetical protein